MKRRIRFVFLRLRKSRSVVQELKPIHFYLFKEFYKAGNSSHSIPLSQNLENNNKTTTTTKKPKLTKKPPKITRLCRWWQQPQKVSSPSYVYLYLPLYIRQICSNLMKDFQNKSYSAFSRQANVDFLFSRLLYNLFLN